MFITDDDSLGQRFSFLSPTEGPFRGQHQNQSSYCVMITVMDWIIFILHTNEEEKQHRMEFFGKLLALKCRLVFSRKWAETWNKHRSLGLTIMSDKAVLQRWKTKWKLTRVQKSPQSPWEEILVISAWEKLFLAMHRQKIWNRIIKMNNKSPVLETLGF